MHTSSVFLVCILAVYWTHSQAMECHCHCHSNCMCRNPQVIKWVRVTRAMITRTVLFGVSLQKLNAHGGLEIRGRVTANGCGRPGSGAAIFIKGNWERIIYTQEFTGSASCWKIFGNTQGNFAFSSKPEVDNGLETFSLSKGDAIMSQYKMHNSASDYFDGNTKRCDNLRQNFWHGLNGAGMRRATVLLRRKKGAVNAGISTETSCGTPRYVIKDIYVS